MAISNPVLIGDDSGLNVSSLTIVVGAGGVPSGAAIYVAAAYRDLADAASPAVADDQSNVYELERNDQSGSGISETPIFRCHNATALAENDEITISGLAASTAAAALAWYTTGEAAGDPHKTNGANGTSSSPNSGDITTTEADCIIYGVHHGTELSDSFTQDANFTTIGTVTATDNSLAGRDRRLVVGYRKVSSTGTYAHAPSLGGSQFWVETILAYAVSVDAAISGAFDAQLGGVGASFVGTAAGGGAITGTMAAALDGVTASFTGELGAVELHDDFECSAIDLANSSVTGAGDDAVITVKPKKQANEITSNDPRWQHVAFKITGANGFRPTFEILDYVNGSGGYWQYPWDTGKRMWFATDLDGTWTAFDTNHTLTGSKVTFRHSTAFPAGTEIYIATHRPYSVRQYGEWLEAYAAANPTMVLPPPSVLETIPEEIEDFPAHDFIVGMFPTQTDSLSNTIRNLPIYAHVLDDPALQPTDGSLKRTAVFTCGTHAAETLPTHAHEAGAEFAVTSDAKAQNFRRHVRLYTYGLINAPGNWGGGFRGGWQTVSGKNDANRNFHLDNLDIVTVPKAAMVADLPVKIQIAVDWHQMWSSTGHIYANGSEGTLWIAAFNANYSGTDIFDQGDNGEGNVATWLHDEYGAPFYCTIEIGEPTPATDARVTSFGEAMIKSISDLIENGDVPPVVNGSMSAQLDGITASFTGTASEAEEDLSITGALTAALDAIVAAFTGTASTPITGTMAVQLDGIQASIAGGASDYPALESNATMLANVGTLMNR